MFIADTLTLDAPRPVGDGYLAVRAKSARTGVYQYAGREVDPDNKHGLRDQTIVNVLRDDAAVFDERAVRSFIGRPITDNHPSVSVNAANWRDHARGTVMGAKWEEGGYLAFDLLLTDASAISAVKAGKRELSNGYQCDVEVGSFKAADGTPCQARQTAIVGNHVAIVDRGRAGPDCEITDSVAVCDANPAAVADYTTEKPKMKITIGDAKDVDLSDGAAVALAVGTLNATLADAQGKVGTLTAELATANTAAQTKDGEIAALNVKLKDAEVTPAKLQQLADARADVIGKAKALAPSIVTDGKSDADIRKEAVTAKLGDSAKDMADAAIEGAFIAFTKDAKPAAATVQSINAPVVLGDAAQREATALQKGNDHNAWRTASAA